MKKVLFFTAILLSLLLVTLSANAVDVYVDGTKINFTDATGRPFIDQNNRTLVPLRITMENLGAEVSWDNEARCAIVTKDATTVNCYIGESCIYRNGTPIKNDTYAIIKDSRTYLPIRAVAEALDATVSWDGSVVINSGGAGNLIHSIESNTATVSNYWKHWTEAVSLKNSGNYVAAIDKFKAVGRTFLDKSDSNSDAMFYNNLGECYSALGMSAEASACFKREADYWTIAGKKEETKDALRRSNLINFTVQMYAKTTNDAFNPKKYFGETYEPYSGLYFGTYTKADSGRFIDETVGLLRKNPSASLIYIKDTSSLKTFESIIANAKAENRIMQIALEPTNLVDIQPNDYRYVNLAQEMENSGVKIFMRFACEMNDTSCPWYTSNYNLYIEKFRIVADIFHKYAPSVPVVWSPNFYPEDTIQLYYPGDDYVDYVGISSYKHHQPSTDPLGQGIDRSRWSDQLDKLCSLYAHKKPIIISEGGASYRDHTTGADITEFASAQALDFFTYLPIKYPSVKAAFLFCSDDRNFRFNLANNATYCDAIRRGIGSDMYLQSPEENANLPHYYELGTNVEIEATVNEISSFIKTPANDISYVVYNIYGTDVDTVYGIPYSANIDFSYYKGTTIPLKAMAFDSKGVKVAEKTYYIKVV